MTVTSNRRPAKILAAVALGSVTSLIVSSPAKAGTATFTTFSNSADAVTPLTDAVFGTGTPITGLTVVGPSFTFQNSGIQVTFSNPQNPAGAAVSRSNTTLGTCLGGKRPASVAVCANPPGESEVPPDPRAELDKITLTFNKPVKLLSTAGLMRSVTGDYAGDNKITSTWQTAGSYVQFNYTNPENIGGSGAYTNSYASTFDSFIAEAGVPVTISTNFIQGDMDYWMQELKVVEVPGPLPLLGVGTAFTCSRRLRRRSKAVRRIELV
jgi:hypothetical protein